MDMNSSPLNPDAPVFVPGSVGSDVLLAESPRKPVPMDDIELPDSAQFRTEAVVRPADLLDLDNCDQLNGHHVSTAFYNRVGTTARHTDKTRGQYFEKSTSLHTALQLRKNMLAQPIAFISLVL